MCSQRNLANPLPSGAYTKSVDPCGKLSLRLLALSFWPLSDFGPGLAVRAYEEDASKADVQAFFFKLLKKEAGPKGDQLPNSAAVQCSHVESSERPRGKRGQGEFY